MIDETIAIDAGPAIGALDALASAAARADEALAKLKIPSMSGAGAGNMARGLDTAAAKVQAAAGKMEASFAKLKAAGAEGAAAMGDIGKAGAESAAGLGGAAKAANDAAVSYGRLGKSAAEAGAALDGQAVAGSRAAKSSAEGAAASAGFFSKHKELILGTGLALGYAVDKAMKFDASMTLLQTQAGVSARQMPQLTKGVLELAGQVGQSPGNLAESLYHVESNMSSLGIKAPQALHMVKVAAEGASVGHANLVDTTNALTAAVASGIPGVKSYDQAMGVLNATVGAGDMSMQDLADAMGTGALAVVKGYGANIKDAGAALAVFGDNNIRGATAGTELRMSVQALAVPAKSAAKELAGLGLTTGTLAKTMQDHGMLAALEQLNAKFRQHGITAKNEGQVLTDLFGKKAGVGLAILMEQMGRLESKYPELTRGANDFGAAWNKTLQTPQQKLNNLIQGTQALAITAGNVLMPYANKALGGIDTGLQWLQSHALASKGLALGAGALVAGGIGKGLFSGVESSLAGLGKIGKTLHIPGLDKLANLGKNAGADTMAGAAAGNQRAADTMAGAAGGMQRAADTMAGAAGESGLGATAGAKGAKAAGAAEGEAAAAGAGASRFKGAAATAGIGLLATATLVDPWLKSMKNRQGNWLDNAFGTPKTSAWNNWGQLGHDITSLWGFAGSAGGRPPAGQLGPRAPATALPPPAPAPRQWYSVTGQDWSTNRSYQSQGPTPQGIAAHPGVQLKPVKVPPPDTSAFTAAQAKVSAAVSQMGSALGKAALKPVKVPAPDISALLSVKGKIASAFSGVAIKPAKVPAPDTSAVDAAKGKAAASGAAITASLQGSMHPAKVPAPNLSAAQAAAGKAQGIGAGISAGLASGILAGEGAVVAAATAVGNAAAAAMARAAQTRSPSKKTIKTGQDLSAGLVIGLQGGQAAVDAAATALGRNAAKATDIAAIDAAAKTLLGKVPKGDTAITAMLKADNKALDNMARQRAKLEQEISDSEQVAKSAVSGASIMNSLSAVNPAGAEPVSSYAVVQGQQYQADSMKQFAGQLMQLQKMGLNATELSQIAQAGPDQGLGIAQGITGGGKQAITQLNQLQKQVQSSAAKIGDVAGPAMFQAGKDMGSGLAAGLKSELGSLDKAMEHLAKSMVASIPKHAATAKKAAVKAAASAAAGGTAGSPAAGGTPARVPAAAGAGGAFAPAAAGLSHAGAALSASAAALTSAAAALKGAGGGPGAAAGGAAPAHPAAGRGGYGGGGHYGTPAYLPSGGGGQHVHYHQNVTMQVQGSVHATNDLLSALQEAQLTRASNNWSGGWQLPGRSV